MGVFYVAGCSDPRNPEIVREMSEDMKDLSLSCCCTSGDEGDSAADSDDLA